MSKNTGRKPRHIPEGKYEHRCRYCGVTFRDNNARTAYCCFDHKSIHNNQSFYARHRKELILAAMLRQTRAKKGSRGPRKTINSEPDFEAMTNEELLLFVQKNPHAIKVNRRS
jgi:hypothetical protein